MATTLDVNGKPTAAEVVAQKGSAHHPFAGA